MTFISWVFKIIIFLVMLGFALSNTGPTTLKFFGSGLEWSAPLVVHLLVFFACGSAFGLLAVLPSWYRGKRQITRLQKEVKDLHAAKKTAMPSPISTDSPRLPITGI